MRDELTDRRVTTRQRRTWTRDRVGVQHFRQRHRDDVLQEVVGGTRPQEWTRRLVTVLLDELHVTDEFDRLVGPLSQVPASQFPRLVAIALVLRHSWSLVDLNAVSRRLRLGCGPLQAELNAFGCDCARRNRCASRRPSPRHVFTERS